MSLTDLKAKKAKSRDKDYKLSHEKGLYLLITRKGGKYWRMKYRYAGKEKTLALGVYPEVSLVEAVDKLLIARRLLREGLDPSIEKKKARLTQYESAGTTFELVARDWFEMKSKTWRPAHASRVFRSLELNVLPHLGTIPIDQIDSVQLRAVLDPMQKRGVFDIAARVRQRCSAIFYFTRQPICQNRQAGIPVCILRIRYSVFCKRPVY